MGTTKTRAVFIILAAGLGLALALLTLLVEAGPFPNRASALSATSAQRTVQLSGLDPTSPTLPVRLVFVHHSTGANWLADNNGGLGIALRDNNYFVSDTNYGWGIACPGCSGCGGSGSDHIGNCTDIGHWWEWFRGSNSAAFVSNLYVESGQHTPYSRLPSNPGGENTIIVFKSCFPNSGLRGNPSDPVPAIENNPLRGQSASSPYHTIANAKGIYIDLLNYFRTRPDRLFVVITAPPRSATTDNARTLNDWLVNDWLAGYPLNNVVVFDFYDVLTTNGGNANTNDLNQENGNHHRLWHGAIQHKTDGDDDPDPNVLEYPTGDDHPSSAGNQKAAAEFLPLLNIYYHRWQAGALEKRASVTCPEHGQAVTYTVVVRGLVAPLMTTVHLTDVVPTGLAYIPGTLTATAGTVTAANPTLYWSGLLTPTPAVTITYGVTVTADTARVIVNTALIVAPSYQTVTRTAMVIANGSAVYLPVIKHE